MLASSLAAAPKVEVSGEGEFALELPRGAWVELGERVESKRLTPAPVERAESDANPWPRVWRAPRK